MTYRYGIMNTNALWPHIGTFLRQLDIPEFTIKLRLKLLHPGLWHYTLVWLAFSSFLSCFPHSFIIFPWSTLSLNHLCLMNFVSESDSKESNLRQWITQFPVGTNENNLATLQLHFDRHPCLSFHSHSSKTGKCEILTHWSQVLGKIYCKGMAVFSKITLGLNRF